MGVESPDPADLAKKEAALREKIKKRLARGEPPVRDFMLGMMGLTEERLKGRPRLSYEVTQLELMRMNFNRHVAALLEEWERDSDSSTDGLKYLRDLRDEIREGMKAERK